MWREGGWGVTNPEVFTVRLLAEEGLGIASVLSWHDPILEGACGSGTAELGEEEGAAAGAMRGARGRRLDVGECRLEVCAEESVEGKGRKAKAGTN